MAKPEEGGQDETDSPAPPEGDKDGGKAEDEVREHVVDILLCQGRLSGLQKQVRLISCAISFLVTVKFSSGLVHDDLYLITETSGKDVVICSLSKL